MVYEDFLSRFTGMSRDTLGENLIGVYLHGSAAMGCFNPAKSDLDLPQLKAVYGKIKGTFVHCCLHLSVVVFLLVSAVMLRLAAVGDRAESRYSFGVFPIYFLKILIK